MMIFKKSIPRRTFLRGMGASVALPLLDAMTPALALTKEKMKAAPRFSVIYAPNGMNMETWTPKTAGSSYELSPALQPFAPYKDKMLVLSGLDNNEGDALPGEGEVAPHERAAGVFLTGVHPLQHGQTGVSIDQTIAREFGQHTQLASLELGLHTNDIVGKCENGWNCAFMSTVSWRTPTTPLPIEYRPRAVFERLFGDSSSTDPAVRLVRIKKDKSLLDSVTNAASRLMKRVGPEDKARLDEYLDGMRDVERRIQMAEQQSSREIPSVERPTGLPSEFSDHLKLMFDLQVLAFQTDMTRTITFMTGPEQSNRTYKEIGVPDVHHSLSHHQSNPEKLGKLTRINRYHSELVSYYLDKLQTTEDVDGSLLDNMIIMYGSSVSDGNDHLMQNLPIVLFGGGAGRLKGGKHIMYPERTPVANLYMTLLDKFGISVEKFGDSNGRLDLLSV
ncbi:MAG: DUF1552 domain-containing protein [Gammaproteobacteria bacterium]|jgi:hypothetical protein